MNTTSPDGFCTIVPAVLSGSLSATDSSTRASPSGSVSLARTSNVVGRPRRVEAMSAVGSGGRLSVPSLSATVTTTLAEADSPRPSLIV